MTLLQCSCCLRKVGCSVLTQLGFGMASASGSQRLRFLICPGYNAASVQGGHGIMFLPSMVLVLLLCRVYGISGTFPVPVIA